MAVCRYHPERPGVGVCVRCRAVICRECRTALDGINYCHACLNSLGRVAQPAAPRKGPRVMAAAGVLLCWLALFAAFWWVQGGLAP